MGRSERSGAAGGRGPRRRGGAVRGRAWTASERGFLESSAGRLSAGKMAAALGRTRASVEMQLKRMGLSRACPDGEVCPMCGALRTGIRDGACPVCRSRAAESRLRAEESRLAALMPMEVRSALCGGPEGPESRVDPPRRGEDDAQRQARELANARRAERAARRRVERMRAAVGPRAVGGGEWTGIDGRRPWGR